MRRGYSVTVSKHGVPILTIEHEWLSGAELSAEDEQAIRDAGEHLLSFVGPEPPADFDPEKYRRAMTGDHPQPPPAGDEMPF
jgi:hypothetical protein